MESVENVTGEANESRMSNLRVYPLLCDVPRAVRELRGSDKQP